MYLREPPSTVSTLLARELQEVVARFVDDEDVPGVSVAAVRGGTRQSAHAGSLDGATRRADDATLYRVASISKTFTARAVLQLRDAGRLALDSPAVERLPELAAVRNPFGSVDRITVRMLLGHTSGLQSEPPRDGPGRWRPLPVDEILSALPRCAVAAAPGSTFKYSNLGFDLLGEIVARVAGTSYDSYVRNEVLGPLGMTSTTLDPGSGAARATGFDPRDDPTVAAGWRPAVDEGPRAGQASGGWWSSVDDLVRWLLAQLTDGVGVNADSIREMHAPATPTGDAGAGYGLGWRVLHADRTIVWHGGITYGFEAILGFDQEAGTGAIALVNGIPSPGSMAALRDRLLDIAAGRAHARPGSAARSNPAVRPPVAVASGTRFREAGFRNEVTLAPGPVLVDAGGRRISLRSTEDPFSFEVDGGRATGETLRLVPDASGETIAIELGGYWFERVREPAGGGRSGSAQLWEDRP